MLARQSDITRRNVEIKARCADLNAVRTVAVQLCGETGTIEDQSDIYFLVPHGRLKLREISGQPAVLIGYSRPDEASPRTSHYQLVPVADPAALKAVLTAALGVRGAVRKRREIFLWKHVRIHLDQVEGLGTFVELEAVLSESDDEAAAPACLAELCEKLGIEPAACLASSYSDLLRL